MHRDRHHSIANCPRPKSYGRTAPAVALLPARRTHRDPYVEAGGTGSIRCTALPVRGEHERAAIVRETGRHVAGRRVDRGPNVLGCRPWVVHAPARGLPEVGGAQPARAGRPEEDLTTVGTHSGPGVVGAGYVELSDVHRGSAGLAVARHRRVVDVRLQQRVEASVEV